jgi:hypothetical protein
MFFTLFIVTHANIINFNFSINFNKLTSKKYKTFRYYFLKKFTISVKTLSLNKSLVQNI